MRPFPLTVQRGGINRLRVKGAARADMLYDLLNAYVTNAGSIAPREGTYRYATLSSSTVGLMAENGQFNVFSTTLVSVPAGFVDNLLIHPTDPTQTLVKIWFAKPFMGFPYVVAQFSNGNIFNYWLQSNGVWTANTVYKTGNIVTPTLANGLAYEAVRDMLVNPAWSPSTTISSGQMIEPTEYTGFAYRAVAVAGSTIFTGKSEPDWPTTLGGTIQEFGNFDATSTTAASTQSSSSSSVSPLGSNITDRYGDSAFIAGQATATTTATPPTASTNVTTWQPGTIYAPGAVVQPGTNQGAFVNAIPNGDFEAGNDGNWVLSDADVTIINNPALAYQGNWSLQFALTTDTDTATMNTYGTVTAGQSVTASAYLNPNNNGANMTMWVNIRWYDSSNTFLSQVQSIGAQGFGYRKVSVTAVAPTGAARVRVQIESSTGTHSINGSYADLVSWSLEQPAAVSNFLYEAIQSAPGTSGATQPTWPTNAGGTVVDNGVTWEAIGTSIITWQAVPIMYSGTVQPTFPTTVGLTVADPSAYVTSDGHSNTTSMSWQCISRVISDPKCPNTTAVALGASHVFEGDNDICDFSAAVNPTDWSTANNAGYLPTGLNNYGDNPIKVLALYRSNLVIFNAGGYQMWQIDPDPQNMALLDAQPVGSIYTRAAQSAANDLMFLAEVGVRNLGTAGATANLQIGNTGQPVDPLVVAQIEAALYDPFGIYYPGRGQYWCMFGPQAFVLTINGTGIRAWSRYVFPDTITDWTLNGSTLFLRTAGNLVWELSPLALMDDQPLPGGGGWATAVSAHGTDDIYAVAYGAGLFVAVGTNGDIQTSPDGITWTSRASPLGVGSFLYNVAFANGVFVASGQHTGPVFLTSPDGITWTQATITGTFSNTVAVCGAAYGNGIWVAISGLNSFVSSNNGGTWAAHPLSITPFSTISELIFDGSFFVTPDDSSIAPAHVGYSSDGITWTSSNTGVNVTTDLQCIGYGGGIYVIGTAGFPTADGIKFTSHTGSGATYISDKFGFPGAASEVISIAYANGQFMAVGDNTNGGFGGTVGYISSSTDGLNWTNITIPAVKGLNGAAWNGTSWVAVGTGGSIIHSSAPNPGANIPFKGVIQWPYLDMGSLGGNKQLIGLDLVGDGQVSIQIAYREDDKTTFSDNANFTLSSNVTTAYSISIADTVPGTPIPIPIDAPSYSLILTFSANQAWDWQAANFYFQDNRGRGF